MRGSATYLPTVITKPRPRQRLRKGGFHHAVHREASRYVAMMTPVPVVTESTRLKFVSGLLSGNRRRPLPSTSGWICSTYSSIRSRCISDWTSTPLPKITRVLSCSFLSLVTASAASPFSSVEFGQGGGGHKLLHVVKRFGEGVGLGLVGPDLREVLVGGAPNQQGPRAAHARSQRLHHGGIVAGRRPPAVLEAITGVLLGPRRPLHHAVERQVLDRHDLAHFSRSSLWISAVMQLSPSVRALGPRPPHTRHHSAGVVQHDAEAGSL